MKFIDLFAGIGGIRLAFEPYGKGVFSSEWDRNSQLTYIANFRERPWGDITKFKARDIPEHDLLLAGFPCQAFSVAGYRKGFEDTRGTLFYDVARILIYHKLISLRPSKEFWTKNWIMSRSDQLNLAVCFNARNE